MLIISSLAVNGVALADADGDLAASAGVTEPIALPTTVTTTGAAVDIFDFTLSDGGGGDGLAMDISQIVVNVTGTGDENKVVFRLNGPDATNVVGTVGVDTITFSGLTISVADGLSEVYTVNAYYGDNTGLTEGQTYILSVDGDTDVTSAGGTTMGATTAVNNGSGTTVDVTATQLVFTAQPSASVVTSVNMGPVTLQAQDTAGNVDTNFIETVTLTDENQGAETDATGTLSTTSNGNSLAVAATAGQVSWADLTYNVIAAINIDANSTSFNVESSNVSVTGNTDGDLTASAGVTEPIALPTTVTTTGAAVDIFDFTLTDGGGGDGLAMDISQIVVNVTGTGDENKVVFRLNGPDVTNVVGTVGADTITFSGLSISVADGLSEVYTVNAYYGDNTGLTEGQTYILSVDGDTDVTSAGGTTMGATTAVNNGGGTTVDVTATQLVFSVQPSATVATSVNMGPVTLQAQDAAGNVDTDFTETITLTDENQGAETNALGTLSTTSNGNSLAVAATAGQVSWADLTYNVIAAINIDANSTSFNVESSNVSVTGNIDGDLTASAGVTEPIALPTTVTTTGAAVDIFDFTLTDGGSSDGLTMDISQIVVNVTGTGDENKVVFRLNGPDVTNVVGTVGADTITFSGLSISVADGLSEVYTVNAYYGDNTGLTEGQTYILSVDGDTDVTSAGGTTMGATTAVNNGGGTTVDVTATQLVFSVQPSATVATSVNMGPVTLQAQDAAGNVDTDFTETITLTDENQGAETNALGTLSTTSNGNSLAVAATAGQVSWADLTYNVIAAINIDANSTSFNVESSNVSVTGNIDGDLTASAGVTEPIALPTTVTTTGAAVDIFDFTLTDGGSSDGLTMDISQIVVNVTGTGDENKVVFRLNGPDVTNVVGTVGADTITFSGLSISVADGLSEVYTVNAYYGDNTGLTEGQTYILSVDGDTNVTSAGGTTMGATTAVNNGSGTTVDVTATQLVFTAQPVSAVIQGANMGPVTLQAQDAAGNVDTDFTETITLTDENQGAETNALGTLSTTSNGNSLAVAATAGQVSWANLTYNAIAAINIDANSTSFNVESGFVTVSTNNTAPVITQGTSTAVTMDEDGSPTSFSLTLNATDAQGNTLIWSIQTPAINGTASVSGTGTSKVIGYTPNQDFNGSDSFAVKVDDGNGLSDSITVNLAIAPINDVTVITDQAVSTGEEVALAITLSGTDADGDALTYSVVSQPSHGVLSGEAPSLTYTPNVDFVGLDSFTFKANDGFVDSDIATVSITVSNDNDAPVITNQVVSTDEEVTLAITLTGTDADGDTLTYSVISQPSHGVLSGEAPSLTYTPDDDFAGEDSFTYKANDGKLDSNNGTISITVSNDNDDPVAVDDEVTLLSGESIEILVLGNDTDADGDTLTVVASSADLGATTVQNNSTVLYQSLAGFVGDTVVQYGITDGNDGNATAEILIHVLAMDDESLPVITLPENIDINASGFLTQVDLGVAVAVDSSGNPVPVTLLDDTNYFTPGRHFVYWQAVDAKGNSVTAAQMVKVNPVIYLSQEQTVAEGQNVTVDILLNGASPDYPLEINYSLLGSADVSDHDLTDTVLVIESGIEGHIEFRTYDDEISEGDELLQLTLDPLLNSNSITHNIIITENNIAPIVSLDVQQDGISSILLSQRGGDVVVISTLFDGNKDDNHIYDWSASSEELIDLDIDELRFTFSPLELNSGTYEVKLLVSDDGVQPLSHEVSLFIEIIDNLPVLTNDDSDGDGIPDIREGFGDDDADGVPDYLDNIAACNILVEQVDQNSNFLIEGDNSGCLSLGAAVMGGESGGAILSDGSVQSNSIPEDSETINIGGIFDFIISQIIKGQVYPITLPQLQPIPTDAVYRKYLPGIGWTNFVEDANNQIASAQGEAGYCPSPDSEDYQLGLTEGYWCVRLMIEDGGPNDADGVANGMIFDPGGVVIFASANTFPVANDDAVEIGKNETVTIEVLENDSDTDGDILSILSATAQHGNVEISNDTLIYSAPEGYLGDDEISYVISDNNGGNDNARVAIQIRNRSPIVNNDLAYTNSGVTIIIDVLGNDTDADNDQLTIVSATAEFGFVSINEEQTLKYTSSASFIGTDTIEYLVSDGVGGTGQGTVEVIVFATPSTSTKSSGGGALNFYWILLILIYLYGVRSKVNS
ncbi:Ig-like domain-containing protein [Shewanella sediminis]|uniref:Ig-like domain-containing protein n=1 Tax=Shewanella sediminis TaxID=271097 RepID=UPI00167FC106|nr:Ig-like domain-containing protein [Shewanella sediminis]